MKEKHNRKLLALLPVLAFAFSMLYSCKENIDMENQYTFQEYTIASYLQEHEATYSEYIQLLNDVKVDRKAHV